MNIFEAIRVFHTPPVQWSNPSSQEEQRLTEADRRHRQEAHEVVYGYEAYRHLNEEEGRAIALAALDLFDLGIGGSQVANVTHRILANLGKSLSRSLKGLYTAIIDRKLFWADGVTFREADHATRDRLLYLLETDLDRVLRDKVLCALAWIGDGVVRETFKRWRQTPPPRRSALFWSPDHYAHVAGWELTFDGTRRDLFHAQCYEFMATGAATRDAISGPVTVFTHTEERCRWCGRHLTILVDCDLRDPRLTFLDEQRERLCIPMCLNCSLQDERIFSDLDPYGVARWSDASGKRPEYLDLDVFDGCEELTAQQKLGLCSLRRTVLATWIIRSKTGTSRRRKISFPACKHRKVGVQSEVVNSILMLEQRYFHVMEKLLVWLVFFPSPTPLGRLLGCAHCPLCWVDQTAEDLIAALHPHRSWQK
jgi:hypothetical protein